MKFALLIRWMKHHKKWWLSPIIFGFLVAGLLLVLSSSTVAPYIYALF